jgi:uroporphyrinogen-III synthase
MQSDDQLSLSGQYIAVPESRQLDILVDMLESRGARVLRLPLVTILDAPDHQKIENWLHEFISRPCELFIILTGEGLRRLVGFAERAACRDAFIQALSRTTKICRGPKPGRALKELSLKPDMLGSAPTTAGIIESLHAVELKGRRVAVQLYGEDPNLLLMEYLREHGAIAIPVAPYIYASNTEEQVVVDFIAELQDESLTPKITAMMFTSQPQYTRLLDVAQKRGCEQQLQRGLARIKIVAVGPVVAEQLRTAGVNVQVMPESSFFMKPMVMALVRMLREK